jgi:hypothetical protein
MQYGALRGASFVVGATCVWGVAKKDNKSSAKIKALFQKRVYWKWFARFVAISLD